MADTPRETVLLARIDRRNDEIRRLRDQITALAALADEMETNGYQSDSDGWGHVAAREIRERLGITPECRCPWPRGD